MRTIVVLAIFAAGYLIGCTGPRLGATDGYYYGNDGTQGYNWQPYGANGPSYYYDNMGRQGVFVPSPGSHPC